MKPSITHSRVRVTARWLFSTTVSGPWIMVFAGADSVSTAEDALTRIEHHCPDAIISDYKLPGMSGETLLKTVKSMHPDLPVILISGYAPSLTGREFANGAADAFLMKPFRIDRIGDVTVSGRQSGEDLTITPVRSDKYNLTVDTVLYTRHQFDKFDDWTSSIDMRAEVAQADGIALAKQFDLACITAAIKCGDFAAPAHLKDAFRDGILVYSQPGALRAADFDRLITAVLELDMDAARAQLASQRAAGVS